MDPMKGLPYPVCDMGHPTRHGLHIDPRKDAEHKTMPVIYRVRIDPKDTEIHAILVYVKCEEGPVVAGLKALKRATDLMPVISAEHVTSVHQCRTGEPK